MHSGPTVGQTLTPAHGKIFAYVNTSQLSVVSSVLYLARVWGAKASFVAAICWPDYRYPTHVSHDDENVWGKISEDSLDPSHLRANLLNAIKPLRTAASSVSTILLH